MKKFKILIMGVLATPILGCAQSAPPPALQAYEVRVEHPFEPMVSNVPRSTTFQECHLQSQVLYVAGHSYVTTVLRCKDDRGTWVTVN